MITVKFENAQFVSESPVSVYEAAKEAGVMERSVITATVDGEPADLSYVIEKDAEVKLFSYDSPEGTHVYRHTAAHIMAQAISHIFPHAKFAYGPANEKGFYYDVDLGETKVTDEDLLAMIDKRRRQSEEENRIAEEEEAKEAADLDEPSDPTVPSASDAENGDSADPTKTDD
jgi:threonyl-tRNA synthetase